VNRFLIGALPALIVLAALFGRDAIAFVEDSYPNDRLKREALARCEANDGHFRRFFSEHRNACYARAHVQDSGGAMPGPGAN